MTVGEALKQLRSQLGLTQEQMAGGIISESYYSKVERDLHVIDAKSLIMILKVHDIDMSNFFNILRHQNISDKDKEYDLRAQIVVAQNRKDLKALDKIASKIHKNDVPPSFDLQRRLENAYVWITHSNEHVSPQIKRGVKNQIMTKKWGTQTYYLLSQSIIMFDIDTAYQLADKAFRSYEEKHFNNIYILIFVANLAINFLNCYYHYHGKREYIDRALDFLRNSLPKNDAIGINNILGTYYEALFNDDKKMIQMIIKILDKSGYLSLIEDTLEN